MGLGPAEKLEKHTLVKVVEYSLINMTGRTGGDGDITQQTSNQESFTTLTNINPTPG